ncbi:MAG: 4Fe-4S binding protein [Oscillospiraceae bacterium]|nr:4Fe-4S binding protein [Oscillospiraceae bacterium]MBR2937798.1 4Fe-4S binding protein [Oscillospiraceae bacterium]
MIRRIITIDEEKCNGCGLCADACHEGAIGIVDGKAKLLREDYCDGLGDCLPACPMNAISFEEREAPAYNEAAVLAAKKAKEAPLPCGCPGSACQSVPKAVASQLRNFPVQIKLLPPNAPYFDGADLLIAADCTAYSYGNFHHDFMQDKITLIGCPKLDAVDYSEKLTEIIKYNNIRSITVTRMTVPCCGGLSHAVKKAIENSGKQIPLHIVTISPDGKIIR